MPQCPCDKPIGGERAYDCDMLGCRMYPHFCNKLLIDPKFRDLYLHGLGPTQQIPRKDASIAEPKSKSKSKSKLKLKKNRPSGGPGTELKKLLAWFGIRQKGCGGCGNLERAMNRWGSEGCRKRSELIVNHMAWEAKRRRVVKYLFARTLASRLVSIAVRRAERKAKRTRGEER